MRETVLLTGYNGFTGRYVANVLKDSGYRVYGIGSGVCNDLDYYTVNLCDHKSLAEVVSRIQPVYVIHLAGKTFVADKEVEAFYQTNLIGSRNLLEALLPVADKLKHVIIASSANIYGNTKEGLLAETESPNPANDYAASKVAMEYIGTLYQNSLPISITRPFNYTGIGQQSNFVIPKIVEHFKAKKQGIELGNINVWREFNDVRFVAEVYKELLQIAPGNTVNICTGKYYSLSQIIEMCEMLTNHRMEVIVNPNFVRNNEVKVLAGNPERLSSIVRTNKGYSIEDTLSWMLNN